MWVRVQGFALQEHDKTTKLYGTIQDITARKQAEERLRESEENLSLVMRSIGDAIITTDAAGLITHLNPTAEQLAGRPLAAAAGHALQRVFPFIEAASLEAVLTSGQSKNSEAAFLAADGTNRWFSTDLNPLRHQEKIAGAVIICRDVTEKRRVDEQLLASDRMASVGILAAGVAHEINNPLAVILANLDFCINDEAEVVTVPELSNNLLEGLIDAHHCAERIRIIVRDLLLFSRAEEDLRQPVDTTRILGSVLRMAQNEIRHRARLRVSHGDIPFVQANEARLGQVFTNLIMNAIQAMPKGQAEANELRVSTKLSAQGEVVISIEDTGLGMSPEVQRRLFTPFFTTKPIGQGTGLGLSICRRIVSNLGGRIELESMLGKGSVFRVFLPASPAKEAPSVKPPAAPTATIQSKLLLIDDETMLVSAIHKTFSTECEVVTSKNGKEALQLLLGGERFDAILCDLMMPDLTGIELHTALLQNAPDQAARMIFMTGDAFNENAATFFEHVPNQRIEKPFRLSELRDLVREHLRKHASHNDPLCQS